MQTHTVARIKNEPSQTMMMEESQLSISQLSPPQVVQEPGEGVATTVIKPEPTADEFTGKCRIIHVHVCLPSCLCVHQLVWLCTHSSYLFSATDVSTIDMLRREIQQLKCQLATSGLASISEIGETSAGIYLRVLSNTTVCSMHGPYAENELHTRGILLMSQPYF